MFEKKTASHKIAKSGIAVVFAGDALVSEFKDRGLWIKQ